MKLHLGFGVLSLSLCIFGCGGGGGGTSSSSSSSQAGYLNVVVTNPNRGETNIETALPLSILFDREVDSSTLNSNFAIEDSGGNAVSGTFGLQQSGHEVFFTPNSPLTSSKTYRIHLGSGLKDSSGTPLYVDYLTAFETTSAFTPTLFPAHGSYLVPTNAGMAVYFTHPVNTSTIDSTTLRLENSFGATVTGSYEFQFNDHVVIFHPTSSLSATANYTLRVFGGSSGVKSSTGETLSGDSVALFQTATGMDFTTPSISVMVDQIPAGLLSQITIPPSGTELTLQFTDGYTGYLNPGSLRLYADRTIGGINTGTNLLDYFPILSMSSTKIRVRIPQSMAITDSTVSFTALASDLCGNPGTSSSLSLKVQAATNNVIPFEHVQVVWTRFDMDRDAEAGADFEKDLLVYGLIAAGDPIGKNAYVQNLVQQGILNTASGLYLTPTYGRVVFTSTQPSTPLYMKIACGGFDPSGGSLDINAPTTGVLGRAIFDTLNASFTNDDTVTNPALGVFPRETFRAYEGSGSGGGDMLFSSTFSGISPDLGGTPVGAHALDSYVLDPNFDYATAPLDQRSRYNVVFNAINRFAKFTGFLLAHEVGHSVGLVPSNLAGTNYHDGAGAAANNVMLAAVSFTSVVILNPEFRSTDISYLMHWILNV